jgi:hypothetical protein
MKNFLDFSEFKNLHENINLSDFEKLYELNHTADFSNDTPFSGSLIGMAINRIFSKLKSKLDIARLMIYRRRLEGEYLAGVLRALAAKGITEKELENGTLENKAQADKYEQQGDKRYADGENGDEAGYSDAKDAYTEALKYYQLIIDKDPKEEYKKKVQEIQDKINKCNEKLNIKEAPIVSVDDGGDAETETTAPAQVEVKTDLEKLLKNIGENNSEILDAIKNLNESNLTKNYALFIQYLYFKKWEEKTELYGILKENINSLYSDVKNGTFKEDLNSGEKQTILKDIMINMEMLGDVNQVLMKLQEIIRLTAKLNLGKISEEDIEKTNKTFNINLNFDYFNKYRSSEETSKRENINNTLKEWFALNKRIKKDYSNSIESQPQPQSQTQPQTQPAQEVAKVEGYDYEYGNYEQLLEGIRLFGKTYHPFGKRSVGDILGDSDLKAKYPSLNLKLLNDKKVFDLFQSDPTLKDKATEQVNKDNIIAIETLARRFYEVPENDYGRRLNLVVTPHDKKKIELKWKELIAKVKGMYKHYLHTDKVDPILLYNGLDIARKDGYLKGEEPPGSKKINGDNATLNAVMENDKIDKSLKILGLTKENFENDSAVGILKCLSIDQPQKSFAILTQFLRLGDGNYAYKFIGLLDIEKLMLDIKEGDDATKVKEKIMTCLYFEDSPESDSAKILKPIFLVLRTKKPNELKNIATILSTSQKAGKSVEQKKYFLLCAINESDALLKVQHIIKTGADLRNWSSVLDDPKNVNDKNYDEYRFRVNIIGQYTISDKNLWDVDKRNRNESQRNRAIKDNAAKILALLNIKKSK